MIERKDATLAKTYRLMQQWDHWLQQSQGMSLLESEAELLFSLLEKQYGKHTVLLGSPRQQPLLNTSVMPHHLLISPMISRSHNSHHIESELHELPIASGSVDLVILPHTLEHTDNPRQLLAEGCRIVKPDGYIIILGFNPISLWGLKKRLIKNKHTPWLGHFISTRTIKNWLSLAEFQWIKQDSILFRPPMQNQSLYKKLKWIEWIGHRCGSNWGGVYMIMAQNKSIPLIPIRTRWKQQLSGVRLSIPKPTIGIRNETGRYFY